MGTMLTQSFLEERVFGARHPAAPAASRSCAPCLAAGLPLRKHLLDEPCFPYTQFRKIIDRSSYFVIRPAADRSHVEVCTDGMADPNDVHLAGLLAERRGYLDAQEGFRVGLENAGTSAGGAT